MVQKHLYDQLNTQEIHRDLVMNINENIEQKPTM
jgi:hypothetical protein